MNDADFPRSPQRRPDSYATHYVSSNLDSPGADPGGGAAPTWSWTFRESEAAPCFYVNGEPSAPADGASDGADGGGTADALGVTHFSYRGGGEDYCYPGTTPGTWTEGTWTQDDSLDISYDY